MNTKHAFPFAIRLDQVARQLLENHVSSPTYPPHNIIHVDDETFTIEFAVAGFAKGEIEIIQEAQILKIRGKKASEPNGEEVKYLHRGIATRKFERKIELAPYVEVTNVGLENGILSVVTKLVVPDDKKPRKIEID